MNTFKFLFQALLIFALSFKSVLVFGQDEKSLVDQSVLQSEVVAKLQFFASDELRGRDTPSPEQEIAAKYLASRMKEWGVKPVEGLDGYFQEVRMKKTTPPEEGSLLVGDSVFEIGEDMILLEGASADLNEKMVFVDYGSREDFEAADVKNKIVVVKLGKQGEPNVRKAFYAGKEKMELAKEFGAAAVIELYSSKQLDWKLIRNYLSGSKIDLDEGEEAEEGLPYLWIDDSGGKRLSQFSEQKKAVRLRVVGSEIEKFTAYNVVGMVEGTDPGLKDEILVFSAHYDHVGVGKPDADGDSIYNGTRDNAIGSVTVMEAAANIGAHPLKRSALFVFFTAEEKGLLGSEWFVDHSPIPLEKMVMNLNSDNAGYNDTTIATIVGLYRTTASKKFEEACSTYGITAVPDSMPEQNLFDRSDQANFARAGVPAVMYSMGMTAFNDEVLKYYHQPADDPDSIDYNYLFKFTRAYVLAGRLIGNALERPYWTEGDKYFEAGEELYNN